MLRIAIISVHACPNPNVEDSGGMNVYLKEMCAELGRRGIEIDVFTLAHHRPLIEELAPNARVVHLDAGAGKLNSKELIYSRLPDFLCNLLSFMGEAGLKYALV